MLNILRSAASVVCLTLALSQVLIGQIPPSSAWEYLGPEGGYLTSMAQTPTGILYAVSYGNPALLYRSTTNGDQWQKISQVSDYIYELVIDAQNPQNIIAIGSTLGYSTSLKVYKSTDGGQTWGTRQFAGQANTSYYPQHLELDPSDSKKITLAGYAYNYQSGTSVISMFECRTTNGGETWTVAGYPNITSGEFYAMCAATDPADSRIRFTGGYVYASGTTSGKLYRTTDNGVTWSEITGTTLLGFVYDVHIDRTNPTRVFAVTGAGIYVSTDRGSSWSSTPKYVYGSRICCDPNSPAILYVHGNGTAIYRSSDGGVNWQTLGGTLTGGSCTSLVLSSSVPGAMYVTTRSGFYRSTNAGQAWSKANGGLACAQIPVLRCVPSNPTSMYVSFMYSGFYKTSNTLGKPTSAGLSWTKLPEYSYCEGIMHMAVHPANPDIIYIQEGAG